LKLYATPLSHFSRKVRILLDCYEAEYELLDVGNVADSDPAAFAHNPLMQVPVLEWDDAWLVDSDAIARYASERLDSADRYRVRVESPEVLNARALMNGVMAAEVTVLLAERTGLVTAGLPFFDKARKVIEGSLGWLEARAGNFQPKAPGYLEFHLVCMWEHLDHYQTVPLDPYGRLAGVAAAVGDFGPVPASSLGTTAA
jgi:glutathione S-transferase